LAESTLSDIKGGDGAENAKLMTALLGGKPGPLRDIVVFNAAAALIIAGRADTLADGAAIAVEAIDKGAAQSTLNRLIEITNREVEA